MTTNAVLFWDIDGTLLTTGRAGIFAFEEALLEVCGITRALQDLKTAGLIDPEVAELALRTAGHPADWETVERVVRNYEQRLPGALHRRRGHPMPGVVEALTDLVDRPDVTNLLLTGNTARGGKAKLEHYDLARFFPCGGAFSDGCRTRSEVASRALELARQEVNGAPDSLTFVIGDTPHDIACGAGIGARTVAVASGSFSKGALAACDPWLVLDRIPEPGRFRELLRVDSSAVSQPVD